MEIKLKLEDNKDLMILWACLNSMQDKMVHQHAELTVKLKGAPGFNEWYEETIEEWNRIHALKKQIDWKLKNDKA